MKILNWFTKKENASPKRGEPLKRVVPAWRGFGSLVTLAVVGIVGMGSAGVWSWNNGMITRAIDQTRWNLIAFSGTLGFTAEDVLVVGRSQTAKDDLLKAVRLARGAPILAYDLNEARQRIKALPWVASATVERMLPNTILLSDAVRSLQAYCGDRVDMNFMHCIINHSEVSDYGFSWLLYVDEVDGVGFEHLTDGKYRVVKVSNLFLYF